MPTLFEELKRRNIFRVAIAYIIVGWVVMQVAEFLSPLLRLPEWTVSMALYVGILGFPFAMLFTWAFELTPEGLKRSSQVHPDDSISHETAGWLNRLMLGLMALIIVGLLADRFILSRSEPHPSSADISVPSQAAPSPGDSPTEVAVDSGLAKSIAVLPFVNMSNDPEQEYFSDGISEELLNALAQIRVLRVAARTSSFAFKGQNLDITDIGQQLKVETVLEGSVRKSGKRLRITAQLINVGDGYHLWSESYDRDITDIFVIQDEISAAIVDALRVHLTGGEEITPSKVVDVAAYNFYLQARHNLRRRTEPSLELATKQYQQALDVDPGYAAAWAGKALATYLLSDSNYGKTPKIQALQQAQMMLDMAFSLDPELWGAHAVQGLLLQGSYQPEESLESLRRAIKTNPSEGILYAWKALALSEVGQSDRSFETLKTAYKIDPLHQSIRNNLALSYTERFDDVAARALSTPGSSFAFVVESMIARREGRHAEELAALQKVVELSEGGEDSRSRLNLSLTYFYQLKNTALAAENMPDSVALLYQSTLNPRLALRRLQQLPDSGGRNSTLAAMVYALIRLGRFEEALAALEPKAFGQRELQGNMVFVTSDIWLAFVEAYCQQQLGHEQEALAQAARIQQFIDRAVANGEPPYYFHLLASVQLLMGDRDAAMQSLITAWDHYALNWDDLGSPWYQSLHQRKEFLALKESMQTHLNGERAKLGWPAVKL